MDKPLAQLLALLRAASLVNNAMKCLAKAGLNELNDPTVRDLARTMLILTRRVTVEDKRLLDTL
jgi:hypothetical protein